MALDFHRCAAGTVQEGSELRRGRSVSSDQVSTDLKENGAKENGASAPLLSQCTGLWDHVLDQLASNVRWVHASHD